MSLVYCLYTVQVPASNRRPTALGMTARRPRAASGPQTRTLGAPEHTHRRTAARLAKNNHGHPHCEHKVGSVNPCARERSSNSKPGVRHSLDAHYAARGRPQSVPASQPPLPMRWWGACSRDRPLRVDLPQSPAISTTERRARMERSRQARAWRHLRAASGPDMGLLSFTRAVHRRRTPCRHRHERLRGKTALSTRRKSGGGAGGPARAPHAAEGGRR